MLLRTGILLMSYTVALNIMKLCIDRKAYLN